MSKENKLVDASQTTIPGTDLTDSQQLRASGEKIRYALAFVARFVNEQAETVSKDALDVGGADVRTWLVSLLGELTEVESVAGGLELQEFFEGEERASGLERCLAYHGPKRWRDVTIAIARSDYFRGDVSALEWVARLDTLQAQLVAVPETHGAETQSDAASTSEAAE